MSIKERFYNKLNEAREQLDEVSKELAKRAENKAAEKFYDKYDSTTDLRKKAIKSKDKKDIDAAKKEEGKMHKAGKQAAKFQKYAAKKKMNEEEQLDEKAKWRKTKVAKKITDPQGYDSASYDYHSDNPKSTGMMKATSDKPYSYGSLMTRGKAKITSKGKVTKSSADKLKDKIKANLKK